MSTNPMERYLEMFPPSGAHDKDGGDLTETHVSPRKLPIEETIDLHGMTAEEARGTLLRFIDGCVAEGIRKILVVHGKGSHEESSGILIRIVQEVLEGHPNIGATGIPEARYGGRGARWAAIRQPRRKAATVPGR